MRDPKPSNDNLPPDADAAASHHQSNLPLHFNGEIIHDRGEMLSLTDMWKAAGSDEARKPAEWLRSSDAKRFIVFLAETQGLEVGKSHDQLVKSLRGGRGVGGSTFAHWQIALAYAKYLSPEFHAWCNTVVREWMEGPPVRSDAASSR